MLTDAKIISFIGTRSPDEARRFYEDGLGLDLVADEPSALVFDSNGTMLRVSKVANFEPAPFTVLARIHRRTPMDGVRKAEGG